MYFGYRFEVPPLQISRPYQKIAVSPQYFPLRSIEKDQQERTKLSYFKLLEAKKSLFKSQDEQSLQKVRTFYGQLQDRQLFSQYQEKIKPNYSLQKYVRKLTNQYFVQRFSLAHEKASNYFNTQNQFNTNKNSDIDSPQTTYQQKTNQNQKNEQFGREDSQLKPENDEQYMDNFYKQIYDQADETIIRYKDEDQ